MNFRILPLATVVATLSCRETRQQSALASNGASAGAQTEQPADSTDWKAVDRAMGRPGKPQPDGTYKYSLPRSDLKVTAMDVRIMGMA